MTINEIPIRPLEWDRNFAGGCGVNYVLVNKEDEGKGVDAHVHHVNTVTVLAERCLDTDIAMAVCEHDHILRSRARLSSIIDTEALTRI